MSKTDFSRLQRDRHSMPEFVFAALRKHDLMAAYESRPAYQQNDYIGWIVRAKREATRQKRLGKMLDELQQGDLYMKMQYRPRN